MSVLEEPSIGYRVSGLGKQNSAPSLHPIPDTRHPTSRFATYFSRTGWIHALLLLSVWLFLFPFLWMLTTSIKTDDELTDASLIPQIPTFRSVSPYVRTLKPPQRPTDTSPARWNQMLPRLTELASQRIAAHQRSHPPQPSLAPFDPDAHRVSAADALVTATVAKLNKNLWSGPDPALVDEFESLLTTTAITSALDASVARMELLTFQLRTLDVHMYKLCAGSDFADTWKVESGPARLFKLADSTLISYHFDSPASPPVVLRYDFTLPPNIVPADIHKLIISLQADNSWHRFDATLDLAGDHWESQITAYIAQFRPMSLPYQPPTFDDDSLRAKTWIPLRKVGSGQSAVGSQLGTRNSELRTATLLLTLSPSSTPRAIYGKVLHNYLRAFHSVPFWTYIWNSVLLVVLTTMGALFSASFVAYAFARLHWPGRSVAFLILLCTMMLPGQVTMIPGFLIWRGLHWYNTLNPLWVPSFFGGAFFIFLMTQHMKTIPKELEEAAKLDGLSHVQSWWYIILPNVKPTLAAISILSFMGAWNEFMGPLIYLRDQAKFPLSLGLYGLKVDQGGDWTMMMAGNMLMTLPVIIVFFLFQRYFVQGMTMTGMKG